MFNKPMSEADAVAVRALHAKLLELLKKAPPMTGVLAKMSFGLWLVTHLSEEDFGLLDRMEKIHGEEDCNTWMTNLMVESGVYKSSEAGYVEG